MNGINWVEASVFTGLVVITLVWLVRGVIKEINLMQSNKSAP
jgi:hypothetical protein